MLTLDAVGLPYDPVADFNTAPRQRVKILDGDAPCHARPPAEVRRRDRTQ